MIVGQQAIVLPCGTLVALMDVGQPFRQCAVPLGSTVSSVHVAFLEFSARWLHQGSPCPDNRSLLTEGSRKSLHLGNDVQAEVPREAKALKHRDPSHGFCLVRDNGYPFLRLIAMALGLDYPEFLFTRAMSPRLQTTKF